jgi:hypothetical protein
MGVLRETKSIASIVSPIYSRASAKKTNIVGCSKVAITTGFFDPQHELITQKFSADTFRKKYHNTDAKSTSASRFAA